MSESLDTFYNLVKKPAMENGRPSLNAMTIWRELTQRVGAPLSLAASTHHTQVYDGERWHYVADFKLWGRDELYPIKFAITKPLYQNQVTLFVRTSPTEVFNEIFTLRNSELIPDPRYVNKLYDVGNKHKWMDIVRSSAIYGLNQTVLNPLPDILGMVEHFSVLQQQDVNDVIQDFTGELLRAITRQRSIPTYVLLLMNLMRYDFKSVSGGNAIHIQHQAIADDLPNIIIRTVKAGTSQFISRPESNAERQQIRKIRGEQPENSLDRGIIDFIYTVMNSLANYQFERYRLQVITVNANTQGVSVNFIMGVINSDESVVVTLQHNFLGY